MNDYTYYYPNGEKINDGVKEFIKFYSRMYYYVDHNFALEAKMEKLLERDSDDELSKVDIKHILSWKTGGKFTGGIIETHYGKNINRDDVYKAYKGWKSNCWKNKYSTKDESCVALIKMLCKVSGVGPVIAITIMYYDSCGEHPIYDRFADIAVQFILRKNEFPKIPPYHTLCSSAKAAYNQYQNYCKNMKEIFGKYYKDTDRDIDRALWVYGHMFSKNKTNQKNEKEFKKFNEWR